MTRLLVAAALAATTAGLVHVFRNRILAQVMPRLLAALRKTFGAAADVRSATLDDRWNLVLEGVRLPLPGGVLIDIESATLTGILGLTRPGGSAGVRLREARGLIVLVGDALPLSALTLPFQFRQDAGTVTHLVEGTLEVREGTWAHRRDDRPHTPYLHVDAHVRFGPQGWTVDHGRLLAGDAVVEGEGQGRPDGTWSAKARFMSVTTPVLEHVLALFDPAVDWRLPADLTLSGLVERGVAGALQLRAEAATAGSSVVADGTYSADEELSGKLSGKLGMAELLGLARVSSEGVHALPDGELMLDARLCGTRGDPSLAGTAFLAALGVSAGDPAVKPVFRFFDVSIPFEVSRDRLKISGLTANAVNGRLTATSAMQFGTWPLQHESELAWDGVRLEQIPTGPDGAHALNALLRGASSGAVRVLGQGGDPELLTAEGDLTLHEPEFLFLRRLETTLSGYGLPMPPLTGIAPCRARLSLASGALDVTGIRGALSGLSFAGDVRARLDGRMSGRLTVTLEPAYLAQGGALSLGAGLGPLDVPLTIAGTLAEPQIAVDIGKAIGGFLKGKSMSNMVGALGNILQSSRPAGPPKLLAAPQESELDGMLGRILQGGPEAERLTERLIETGISPDEVRDMLADYRRRRGN